MLDKMLDKLIYANLGYESSSINIILNLQNQFKEYNPKIDILEINKEIKEEKANIIKESGLSETEVNKFFEENEILSTTSNNGLNAVIFRNKTTNEIEISVGGTEDAYDYINNAFLITTGYPFSQGIELNNFIKAAEENGLIKPTDKINFYGHSLGKAIIETTLITYYANDTSKLEQINQLSYFNGASISRNNKFLINHNGLQDQNMSIIQNLYNKENLVNDIIVDSGFDVVPNSILTGFLSRTLITDDIRIGVGFDSENVRLNYNYHFLSVAYKILKADDFVLSNNLSETDKQNLYNIYNVNFNNGTDIEKFENLLLLYSDKSSIIKTLDGLTNLKRTDLINQILNNPEDMNNILNNLSEEETKQLELAIFVKENTIYNFAVKLTINSDFMDIFNKDEESNMKIKKAVEQIII